MTTNDAAGHAFVSYVHEDDERVDELVAFLEAYGVRVWRDKEQLWPGDEWKLEIRRAIQTDALAFIACFSEATDARKHTYQNEELTLAIEEYRLRRPGTPWLFPVRLGAVSLPAFDLGAGKTLDDLQRSDLFGATTLPNLGRLAASISRVLATSSGAPSANAANSAQPLPKLSAPETLTSSTIIKAMLRDPTKDIDLDDYITGLADTARSACLDPVSFPTSSDLLSKPSDATFQAVADLAVERCDAYWEIVKPLCEGLAVGCCWGVRAQDSLWTRAMQIIGNTDPLEGGHQLLLDLRGYPRLMAMYAAGLGAMSRKNYGALKAVTIAPKHRNNGQNVPLIGLLHIWGPFSSADWVASVVARHSDGVTTTLDEMRGFTHHSGGRKTPVSDDLHTRLREVVRDIIRDDEDYDEAFDQLEVLFGVIAADNAATEKAADRYAYGGWAGRYVWRGRYAGTSTFDQMHQDLIAERNSWAPLTAGLFDGSVHRADAAFGSMQEMVHSPRLM